MKAAERSLKEISKNDADIIELVDDGAVYCKGYDIDGWVRGAAKKNPDVLFVLSGDGEGSDDLWELRCKGDLSELHEAVIPPFTDPRLKSKED